MKPITLTIQLVNKAAKQIARRSGAKQLVKISSNSWLKCYPFKALVNFGLK